MTKEVVKDRQEIWAARWAAGDEALKAQSAEDLEKIAEHYGMAVTSVRNARHVAKHWPKAQRRAKTVSYAAHEVLASLDDRFDLIKESGMGVARARQIITQRKASS